MSFRSETELPSSDRPRHSSSSWHRAFCIKALRFILSVIDTHLHVSVVTGQGGLRNCDRTPIQGGTIPAA